MGPRDYHNLEIWHRSMDYTVEIYRFTELLPESERYNLTQQLRKAATSVPLNIAEGSGCVSDGEFARFLSYSYRSLKETITCFELILRLFPKLPIEMINKLIDEGNQIARMTHSFMQKLDG